MPENSSNDEQQSNAHASKMGKLESGIEEWSNFFEYSNDLFSIANKEGYFVHLNPYWEKILGYTNHELKSKPIIDFVHPDDRQLTIEEISRLNCGREVKNFNNRYIRKDKSICWLSWNSVLSPDGEKIFAVARDLTEYMNVVDEITRQKDQLDFQVIQRNAELTNINEKYRARVEKGLEIEKALKESQQMLHLVLNTIPQYVFWKDRNSVYLGCNERFAHHAGLFTAEDINGKTDFDLPWSEDEARDFRDWDQKIMEQNEPIYNIQEKIHFSDGSMHWLNTSKIPLHDHEDKVIGILGCFEDITEKVKQEERRQHMEKQIQQAQKLESLGLLVGGVAHDFNNFLMGILGNASLALMDMPTSSPWREYIEEIEKTAHRASDLTRQMLAYSGKGKFVIESLNLSLLIKEMVDLLKISISKNISLTLNLDENPSPIDADASQIRQVVMNLITNASEAIGDKNGTVSVNTGSMECDSEYLRDTFLNDELPGGLYTYLEVSDNGCGIEKSDLQKIFDPFYSTKFIGRGLGLAAVLGIIRGHQGALKVYSEIDSGTTFKCIFPASAKVQSDKTFKHQIPESDRKEKGTILVVDDDPVVRNVAREILKRYGFQTIEVSDGSSAIKMFQSNPNTIDLILLDMTMPGMSGEQTFRELRRLQKNVKVILSSGYNEQEVIQRFAGKGLAGFIQKPYQVSSLISKIRNLLDSDNTPEEE